MLIPISDKLDQKCSLKYWYMLLNMIVFFFKLKKIKELWAIKLFDINTICSIIINKQHPLIFELISKQTMSVIGAPKLLNIQFHK